MRSLVVARSAERVAAIVDVLRREGFAVDVAPPPVTKEHTDFAAIFLDDQDGETAATLDALRALSDADAPPFVAVLGVPSGDEVAATYVRSGAQTCLPVEPGEFERRMRFITNAIQVRAKLSAAMRELRATEERWRVAIGALDEGIIIQAADGRVTSMNAAAGRILGMTPEEVEARAWRRPEWVVRTVDGRRVPLDDLPGARALREKRPIAGEVYCLTGPRGDTLWGLVSSHPILDSSAGTSAAVVTTIRDLTEQRRLEMHVMTTERLTSLGRLAASVGHEINNPLTYVLGGIDGVARRLRALGLREEVEMLDEAMLGADRIRTIVRDLRVFSTRSAEAYGPVDVRRVVESCTRMAMAEIRPRARLVATHGEVPLVRGNEARLAQVVLNLLVNAAQSLPEGGLGDNVVAVETRREPDGRVAIVVRDTGVGIASENLPLVTEPFFTTRAESGGTGLGLSICKALVAAQGGELRIASPPGGGTEVTVLLLAATDEAAVAAQDDVVVVPTARHRVLVIDDEPLIARLIGECLRGCEVTIATGGRQAIGILRDGLPFDAVVCDLMMPETSGVDVHAFVLSARPTLEPHMLFITGGAYTPRALAFVASVAARCLEKPFTPDAIVLSVERAVKGF